MDTRTTFADWQPSRSTTAADAHAAAERRILPLPRWDAYDAYLFDIDGTLLRCKDRIHFASFAEAFQAVTGERSSLDGITLHGNTDTAILQQMLRRHAIAASEASHLIPQILDAMQRIVFARKHALVAQPTPGSFSVLQALQQRGKLLAVATGNVESIGWLKLEICGQRDYFQFGAFCDATPKRAEILAQGAAQARTLAGAQARICVVGDTPADIAAARANSLPVLAVATGAYAQEHLRQHGPEYLAASLQECLTASLAANTARE
jgi:phosphoglycolate phosphatase